MAEGEETRGQWRHETAPLEECEETSSDNLTAVGGDVVHAP
jgi:hypothetical protein